MTTVLLPLALAGIMIALGFTLTAGDFRRVVTAPRGVLIGLANLVVLAPALAFVWPSCSASIPRSPSGSSCSAPRRAARWRTS